MVMFFEPNEEGGFPVQPRHTYAHRLLAVLSLAFGIGPPASDCWGLPRTQQQPSWPEWQAQLHIGPPDGLHMARREESVDTELLAQMESGGDRIRSPAEPQGQRDVRDSRPDPRRPEGAVRLRGRGDEARQIPGKMCPGAWVREGDLIVVQPGSSRRRRPTSA